MKKLFTWLFVMLALVGLSGCVKQDTSAGPKASNAFRILAGSELKDVAQEVVAYGSSQGVRVEFEYTGSLDAVDRLMSPHEYDAVWLSHGKYLGMVPEVGSQVVNSEKTMFSRVVLGVKPVKAAQLGWDNKSGQVSWHEVLAAVKAGKIRLAMTNPSGSNTGFVTLVGVAAELSGKGDALEEKDIPAGKLKDLFSGISLTSGSSGVLADKFVKDPNAADAIVTYEASIRSLKQQGVNLTVLVPKEGVITADYPLMLLKSSKQKAFYDSLVAYLRSPEVRKNVVARTFRTPFGEASDEVVNELPFPSSPKVVNALLDGYLNQYAKPTSSYFVLDISGSMSRDGRLDNVKRTFETLANGDGSVSGRFATFRDRESIRIVPFSNKIYSPTAFSLGDTREQRERSLHNLHEFVYELYADGGTAIYDAILSIYRQAQNEMRSGKRNVSIVLLTDGDNNTGTNLRGFIEVLRSPDMEGPQVPVFPIVYGEANANEMNSLASATGGQMFDARKTSLSSVMKAIRAYQ